MWWIRSHPSAVAATAAALIAAIVADATTPLPVPSPLPSQAQQISPHEPLVLHELGVLHYFNGDYEEAIVFFLQVGHHSLPAAFPLQVGHSYHPLFTTPQVAMNSEDYDEQTREPSIFNLGHAYR